MKILAIDCSALAASVALTDNEKLIGEYFTNVGLTHSQTLMPMVENVLNITQTKTNEIDIVAVSTGPGSFTGVRIGVAAVKGLAQAQNIPCFAVSSTETIAYALKSFNGVVCAVMDARCNQVYTALFKNGRRISDDEAILISQLREKLTQLNENIILAGDAAQMCFECFKDMNNVFLSDSQFVFPRASSVCYIAKNKIELGENTVTASELLPVYLRLPQAQRELNNKKSL